MSPTLKDTGLRTPWMDPVGRHGHTDMRALLKRGCRSGPGSPDGGPLFYQTRGLFVPLEDAGLDQAREAVTDVARRGGADAVHRFELGGRRRQDLGQ